MLHRAACYKFTDVSEGILTTVTLVYIQLAAQLLLMFLHISATNRNPLQGATGFEKV